jgi:hypothetical protein
MNKITTFIIGFCLFLSADLLAQRATYPYSRFGIGKVLNRTSVASAGMGGLSTAYGSSITLNINNPALLTANPLTIFDFAVGTESRKLETATEEQNGLGGSLQYFAFGFPVGKGIHLGLGLTPYSEVNYKAITFAPIPNSTRFAEYTYQGNGGMTQIYTSIAKKFAKKLSVGAQFNYNFGTSKDEAQVRINDGASLYKIEVLDRVSYGDISLKLGTNYDISLPDHVHLNIAATYSPSSDIGIKEFRAIQRKSLSDAILTRDTVSNNTKSFIRLPQATSFGFTLQRPLKEIGLSKNHTSFALGADVTFQDWTKYEGVIADTLSNSYKISVGGEITPNLVDVSANYFQKVTYRAGASYEQTPFLVNGQNVTAWSVSAGFSLPSPRPSDRYQSFSRMNLSFVYGQQNVNGNETVGIKSSFFEAKASFTIQQLWFVRRRIN